MFGVYDEETIAQSIIKKFNTYNSCHNFFLNSNISATDNRRRGFYISLIFYSLLCWPIYMYWPINTYRYSMDR